MITQHMAEFPFEDRIKIFKALTISNKSLVTMEELTQLVEEQQNAIKIAACVMNMTVVDFIKTVESGLLREELKQKFLNMV